LLGIAVFEADLDVIDHAADRQMAHVRTFQAGKNGALSQQLLNELSAARLCLLNPAKKSAYDEALRAKINGAPRAVPVSPSAPKAAPVSPSVSKAAPASAAVPQAAPVAVPVGKAEPVGKAVPLAKPLAAVQSASRAVEVDETPVRTARVRSAAGRIELDVDDESVDALMSSPDFRIQAPRRSFNRDFAWKRPLALGIVAAVVAISFVSLFYVARNLTRSQEWKHLILGEPDPAATAPADLGPAPEDTSAPPPPGPGE
jgi:hypothetical protein